MSERDVGAHPMTGPGTSAPPRVVIAEWQNIADFHQALTAPMTKRIAATRRDEDIAPLLADADVLVSASFTRGMAAAATRLRLIQTPGAGTDLIDFDAVPAGTTVCNVYGHERGMAEYVVMTMAALNRDLLGMNQRLRTGDWRDHFAGPQRELRGRILAVLGLGRIGREVARAGSFFGMRVAAVTRSPDPARAREVGVQHVVGPDELPALLGEADFVVVAVPLSPATRGLIGRRELAAMKASAYLINIARGDVVDEAALYEALASRAIAGAAIDVWYQYPAANETRLPSRLPFHELDNVLMTPHVSGATDRTFAYRWRFINDNISRLAAGEPLQNVVHSAVMSGGDQPPR
jgi:phosphoglycerate dehydrogenase-like enzyme